MKSLKGERFWKCQGAGNDFIFFERAVDSEMMSRIPILCDQHYGIGADGVVFAWKTDVWNWRFFNSDNSETDLCGNAARCFALWLSVVQGVADDALSWKGKLGQFYGKRAGSNMEVHWPLAVPGEGVSKAVPEEVMEQVGGFSDHGLASLQWIQVGVPHLVLINHEVWNPEQRYPANGFLRSHPQLGSEGANVTWLSLKNLEVVTFERGVETETKACGSGALAAFLALEIYEKKENSKKTFAFPGGALSVRRDENQKLWLGGQAEIVFSGEVLKEF